MLATYSSIRVLCMQDFVFANSPTASWSSADEMRSDRLLYIIDRVIYSTTPIVQSWSLVIPAHRFLQRIHPHGIRAGQTELFESDHRGFVAAG